MPERKPLAGIRVLEWAEGISGPVAGWLLAEAGAEVVKIERPGGDRLRAEPGFRVVNRGKRGLVLDPAVEGDRERFRALVADADVVIADELERDLETHGLGFDRTARPGLVWCAVPAFGKEGPRAGLPPDDALVEAASGNSAMQWSYSGDPVWFVTPMASYAGGFLAALGVTAALRARARTGEGQRLDTSALAGALLLQSGSYVTGKGHEGSLALQANDPRGVFPTYGFYETADGWIFVGALTDAFWASLATLLERTDLLADPDLPSQPMAFGRPEIRERLRRELEPIFRGRPTAEWLRRLEDADVPVGRVQSRAEYLREPLAEATRAVVRIGDPELGPVREPGVPVLFDGVAPDRAREEAAPLRVAAGLVPASAESAGQARLAAPLEGVRVLDLASFIAGPLCPMLLADLGADVVKIESPQGDPFRLAQWGFEGWNRGKRAIVLDLKTDEGRRDFLRLVDTADVVVENFRGGVMDALGLGAASLRERNPRLVYTAITGFGSSGPDARRPGFDPVMQARSGFSRAQGGDDEPVLHQIAYTDYMTGTLAAWATVAALVARERTGEGCFVDASLHRTAYAMQAAVMIEVRGTVPEVKGGRDFRGPAALRRLYRARDGWICLAVGDAAGAGALGRVVPLGGDPRDWLDAPPEGEIAGSLAAAFAAWERDPLVEALVAAGVPAAPCLTYPEVFTDPHLRANRLVQEHDHPRLGHVRQTGEILRFSRTPMVLGRPAPALDEHGEAIRRELLSR